MYNTYNPIYSLQQSGTRTRVLATTAGATSCLVTVPAGVATVLVRELESLRDSREQVLHIAGRDTDGRPCYLRRNLMAAAQSGRSTLPGDTAVWPVLVAAIACTDAERRAVSDEVGRLLDGTEDVIVPCVVDSDTEDLLVLEIANSWLDEELQTTSAAQLSEAILDIFAGESGMLFEGLLAHLRSLDTENGAAINACADHGWVDVDIDQQALAAWATAHLPGFTEQLNDLLNEIDHLPEFTAGSHRVEQLTGN